MPSPDLIIQVPGEGPRNSPRIAIVGEAPGEEEASVGRPFVGASGRLLDGMLAHVGIMRNNCYVTNTVKLRPPKNDFGTLYEDSKRNRPTPILTQWWEHLRDEIRSVNPNLILCIGGEALRAVAGKRGIEKWRGSLIPSDIGPKCVATYHSANVLRFMHLRAVSELDLQKALRHSSSPSHTLVVHNLYLDKSASWYVSRLRRIKREKIPVAFDIETCGKWTRCIGFAWSSREGMSIPLVSNGTKTNSELLAGALSTTPVDLPCSSHWPEHEERLIHDALKDVLEDPAVPLVAQNFAFDSSILRREFGWRCRGLVMDTMLAHHACYAELGKPATSDNPREPSASGKKSLDFLCSIYTDVPRYSDYDASSDLSTWRYNGMDCCVTFEVHECIKEDMEELKVADLYHRHVAPTMYTCTRMQNRGIVIDDTERKKFAKRVREGIEENEAQIEKSVGRSINPNSPKQMQEYLYGDLKLKRQYKFDHKSKTRRVTADEEALQNLQAEYPQHSPFLDAVLQSRGRQKLLSTVLEVPLQPDGTLTTSYNVAGTVNGRLSSSSNVFDEGMNVQQINKGVDPNDDDFGIRRIIVATPGHVLIRSDLKQAEAMVVAWVARISTLIDRFTSDPHFDIHRWNATNIYQIDEADVTKAQRSIAKPGVHGGNYGLGARKASAIFGIPFPEAKLALDAYRNALPEVAVWWSHIQAEIHSSRTLFSPLGRRRTFLGRIDDSLYRSAYSFIPQATVVDIILRALWLSEEVLQRSSAYPILQVHDEIVFSCPSAALERVLVKIRRLMEYTIPFEGLPPLTIPAETSYGPNWHDQEEVA